MKRIQSNKIKKNLFNIGVQGGPRFSHVDKYLMDSKEFDITRDTWKPNTNYKRKDN